MIAVHRLTHPRLPAWLNPDPDPADRDDAGHRDPAHERDAARRRRVRDTSRCVVAPSPLIALARDRRWRASPRSPRRRPNAAD